MPQKIILLGCGAVSKCVLHYLPKFLNVDYKNVYIVDKQLSEQNFPSVQKCIKKGAHYIHYTLTSRNVDKLFKTVINTSPRDVVIDLTTRTDCNAIFKSTRKNQLHYINTSIEEVYHPDQGQSKCDSPVDHTIWLQHMKLYDVEKKTKRYNPPTSVMEFGMNPGLISIFVKQGILDIAKHVLANKKGLSTSERREIQKQIRLRDYVNLGAKFKIRTIHCSELDTQEPNVPIPPERFVNTWSCLGLVDEAMEPAEVCMGNHEKKLPLKKHNFFTVVDNLVAINKPSISLKFYSYVPKKITEDGQVEFTELVGVCIHHGENITLNRYMATEEWAPTIHYVYQPCPLTTQKLKESSDEKLVEMVADYRNSKVMNVHDEKLEGYDNVGACFLLEENPVTGEKKPWAFWTGSILDTNYTQHVLKDPYFGPTPIQVMAGLLSAISYAIEHPTQGMLFSEDIPESYIIKRAKKYLGKLYSGPVTGCNIRGTSMKDLFVGTGALSYPTSVIETPPPAPIQQQTTTHQQAKPQQQTTPH
jgi:homospermidine synthase